MFPRAANMNDHSTTEIEDLFRVVLDNLPGELKLKGFHRPVLAYNVLRIRS